jgi:hypothetical protein
VDVVGVLTDSTIPKRYWSDLKIKLKEEGFESYDKIVQLKLKSGDGKEYETDCSDTEGIFRIIQSIPSKKAEPFKRWLAKVGYERIQEIENPELAQDRMKQLYEQKGYSKEWIDKRLKGIAVRQNLTEEWKKRGVEEENDFAILYRTNAQSRSIEEGLRRSPSPGLNCHSVRQQPFDFRTENISVPRSPLQFSEMRFLFSVKIILEGKICRAKESSSAPWHICR